MNSVLLAPEFFKSEGGIARILRLYLKALCELSDVGDQVRLVALNDGAMSAADLGRYSDNRLVESKGCGGSKLRFALEVLRMGSRADRVVCGHVAQLPAAWAASKLRPGLRYYLVAHGIEVWRPFTFLERRALKGAQCILCVSEFTRQQILKNCDLPAERTAVVSNALDPSLDTMAPVLPPEGAPMILSVSRLSIADSYKGIEHLLMAMPAILQKIPGARLRIVGKGDGLPGLQALARGLNLEDAVQFTGFRSDADLAKDLDACRLFALPSQKEGFGLVYLEAMAHGRPCLGARSGGVPEVITPETGILVDYGDIKAIASAVVAALNRDWNVDALVERSRLFSFARLRDHLASVLSA